jgi:hypothetical protein
MATPRNRLRMRKKLSEMDRRREAEGAAVISCADRGPNAFRTAHTHTHTHTVQRFVAD